MGHRSSAFNTNGHNYNYPLYRAIRKYGIENFSFEILEECLISELNQKEVEYVKQYDTFFHGYNQTLGGDSSLSGNKEQVIGVIYDLESTTLTHKQIAQKWKVSIEIVQGINTGRYWKQDRDYPIRKCVSIFVRKYHGIDVVVDGHSKKHTKCVDCGKLISYRAIRCVDCEKLRCRSNVPDKDTLYQLLLTHKNFTYVGKLFSVSDNAVKKWCKSYGLPHLTSDYKPKKKDILKKPFYPPRPVAMVDLHTGKTIKTFPSKHNAEIELRGKVTNGISHVLQGKCKSMYGYGWKYVDESN